MLAGALASNQVAGASASDSHTAVWTEEGELFTFGQGVDGRLGHGGEQDEHVPRPVEALAGKKMVGAAAGDRHTAVSQQSPGTEDGEVVTFGAGASGCLSHGETARQARLVASACRGWPLPSRNSEHAGPRRN